MFLIFIKGVFFALVQGPVFLEECPQDSNSVEEVSFKVKAALLPKPELVVVVVQALFGYSQSLCSFQQAHLSQAAVALMEFPPPLHHFNHLEKHSLLAAFLLD